MEITEIPFARTIGLKKSDSEVLELPFDDSLHNHLQTIAASAQYSLAELASGDYMQLPTLITLPSKTLQCTHRGMFIHFPKYRHLIILTTLATVAKSSSQSPVLATLNQNRCPPSTTIIDLLRSHF